MAVPIVQPWMSPPPAEPEPMDVDLVFKDLSRRDKLAVIEREVEENGIERPLGYNVSFHYNPTVEYHHFGRSHPMKPWRLTLTKQLILSYGLPYAMDMHETLPATYEDLNSFHGGEYLDFLRKVTPRNMDTFKDDLEKFGFGGDTNDCPVFDGLWDYVSIYSGASVHAANALRQETSNIAINWSGGLHHAKKSAASGFCYINDIVLAIQLLLTVHQRVLYIDIDVHHGDGVEQAFWSTPRVFTLSFHKYGEDFFPGTGAMDDTGPRYRGNPGTAHALNIPIDDGIDDHEYQDLFQHVVRETIDRYRPGAVVLQCGADSLGGDRLGRFNLNIKAHGSCVEFLKRQNLPLLLLGGGGYTPRNVARTWCHETAVCVGATLHNNLPTHIPYIQAFEGEENGNSLLYPNLSHLVGRRHENKQTKKSLEELKRAASENLSYLEGCPTASDQFKHVEWAALLDHIEAENRRRQEEAEEKEKGKSETERRRKERNVGGRLERR